MRAIATGSAQARRLCALAALIAALSCLASCISRPPPQAELTEQFQRHHSDYSALRKMMLRDGIGDVLDYGSQFRRMHSYDVIDAELTRERAAAYRTLMKRAGIKRMYASDNGEAGFMMAGAGMASSGWRVLLTWENNPPSPLLDSLDRFRPNARNHDDWQTAYALAQGRWYFKIIW